MNVTLSPTVFSLFRAYISKQCGIDIPEDKAYLVETRLSRLLADSHFSSFEELYSDILLHNDPVQAEKIIDAITTNETSWFRDKTPWNILEDIYLPKFIEEIRCGRKSKIRIWSAAASTGQEIYSTAMCVDSWLKRHSIHDIGLQHFEFVATDISKTVLRMAQNARYDAISIMRGLDAAYKANYFVKNGAVWTLNEQIRSAVTFRHFNLQGSFILLGTFDVIFCRYVMIYFSDALKREMSDKLRMSLYPDSPLFLGASELYSDIDRNFSRSHYGNGSYYIRRDT